MQVVCVKCEIGNMGEYLRGYIPRFRARTDVMPQNKELILKFDTYIASTGIKNARRYKYFIVLEWLSRKLGKDFKEAVKEDFIRIISELEDSDYAEWTKSDYKILTKRFYKWLKGDDEEYPQEVRWIKCPPKTKLSRLPEELITEEEVKAMADAASRPRDKAFVQMLYESGCRISELLTLQMKNISFDGFGAILRVSGKTGDRRVRIVASAPSLASWVDFHPYKEDPEAYLFARNLNLKKNDRFPFRYAVATKTLQFMADKAGIKKKVNPHSFRHARASMLANKLTEAQMKEYFGWVQGSKMASIYVHLSGRDVDNAILDVYGLRKDNEKSQTAFCPITCVRCNAQSSPGSKICGKCGQSFSSNLGIEADKKVSGDGGLMKKLMQDEDVKELLLKKMMEMNLELRY